MKKLFLALSLSSIYLFSHDFTGEDHPFHTATLQGDPNGCVMNRVSAISGELFFRGNALIANGAAPVSHNFFYSSFLANNEDNGFVFMPYTTLHLKTYRSNSKEIKRVAYMRDEKGTFLKFKLNDTDAKKIRDKHKLKGTSEFVLSSKRLHNLGATNTASGAISAQTNPKNYKMFLNHEEGSISVYTPEGGMRYYKYASKDTAKSEFNAYLEYEKLPTGHVVFYEWNKNEEGIGFLRKVHKNPEGFGEKVASFDLHYPARQDTGFDVSITSSDTKSIDYHYSKTHTGSKRYHYTLSHINGSDRQSEHFDYTENFTDVDKKGFLNRIGHPDGRFLSVEYYKKGDNHIAGRNIHVNRYEDPLFGRVSRLLMPTEDGQAIPVMSFIYHLAEPKIRPGHTEVYDVYNNKTLYHYSSQLRLEWIEKFQADKADALYLKERFVWDGINLASHSLLDAEGRVFLSKRYHYDESGNVQEMQLIGNLTGHSAANLTLEDDGYPRNHETDVYTTRYTYCPLDIREQVSSTPYLKTIEKGNGHTEVLHYHPKTNLVTARLHLCHGKIARRYFYFYNEFKVLVSEIVDDGSQEDPNNLENVKERRIKRYEMRREDPYFGLPASYTESFYDVSEGKEIPLKKVELIYTKGASIEKERCFDSEGVFQYEIQRRFDEQGRVTQERDPLGRSTYFSYDSLNNKTFVQEPSGKMTFMSYDLINRLRSKKVEADGLSHESSFSYTHQHKIASETDAFGRVTVYDYDSLGHLTNKRLPEVVDENGNVYQPYERYMVDNLGRIILLENSLGEQTRTEYSAYDKPTRIIYPDGRQEVFYYYLDGNLKDHIDKGGNITSYVYDPFDRVIQKTIKTASSKIIEEERFTYSGFQLIEKEGLKGIKTRYFYDGAGRKIKEEVIGDGIHNVITFSYDAMGRMLKSLELNSTNCIPHIKHYNLQDKVIEEYLENEEGEKLNHSFYEYDSNGNCSKIAKRISEEQLAQEYFFYDVFSRLVKKVDAEGRITTIQYDENYQNALNQRVLKKTTTYPSGACEVEIHDALDRVVELQKIDDQGSMFFHEEYFYDKRGNKARILNHVVTASLDAVVDKRLVYDVSNNLISSTEILSSQSSRTITYSYDAKGNLKEVTKPDGITLYYDYDEFGRNIKVKSSDGSVHYSYEYNSASQVVSSFDYIDKTYVKREYDTQGNRLFEKLANGLKIGFSYDEKGRRKELIYPDKTKVCYEWDSLYLKAIYRKDKLGKVLYSHEFTKYDGLGRLKEEKSLYGYITTNYERDLLGRLKSSSNRFESYNVKEFDAQDRIKALEVKNSKGVKLKELYYKSPFQTDVNYHYDENGLLTCKASSKGEQHFTYDALDRLKKVTLSDGSVIVYTYDGFNRRVRQETIASAESKTQFYVFDQDREIGIYSERYVPEIVRILADSYDFENAATLFIEKGGSLYIALKDLFGSVSSLIDARSLKSVESYTYSLSGKETIMDAGSGLHPKSMIGNPWRYQNARVDEKTGLMFALEGVYDKETGVCLTPYSLFKD